MNVTTHPYDLFKEFCKQPCLKSGTMLLTIYKKSLDGLDLITIADEFNVVNVAKYQTQQRGI